MKETLPKTVQETAREDFAEINERLLKPIPKLISAMEDVADKIVARVGLTNVMGLMDLYYQKGAGYWDSIFQDPKLVYKKNGRLFLHVEFRPYFNQTVEHLKKQNGDDQPLSDLIDAYLTIEKEESAQIGRLMVANNGLVKSIALKVSAAYDQMIGMPAPELFEELITLPAYLGIKKAAEKYDPSLAKSFSTYAYFWLFSYMKHYCDDQRSQALGQVPVYQFEQIRQNKLTDIDPRVSLNVGDRQLSLDAPGAGDDKNLINRMIAADPGPEDRLGTNQTISLIAACVKKIPQKTDRLIFRMLYGQVSDKLRAMLNFLETKGYGGRPIAESGCEYTLGAVGYLARLLKDNPRLTLQDINELDAGMITRQMSKNREWARIVHNRVLGKITADLRRLPAWDELTE